ncbi:hypothetical protein [Sigmofec virus UA08Rod_5342]|uniref:Uncharacterized protein n=1 Tax=Sigmofec virus UA08Rod_5342 TaxID=2929420 RepID=A0A976N155_9VIRU|nr:hypothetical protein [Sigmofec virus UA08Rod_5342]
MALPPLGGGNQRAALVKIFFEKRKNFLTKNYFCVNVCLRSILCCNLFLIMVLILHLRLLF